MPLIDLRSDTVTRPSAGMLAAMARAETGDDVFGEDPTVKRLESMIAERLAKSPPCLYRPAPWPIRSVWDARPSLVMS